MADKVALVTGSGKKRVGHTIALDLARAGYNIVVHYNTSESEAENTVEEIRELGREAISVQADVTSDEALDKMFQSVKEQFGRLDVLVCSAATWGKATLQETTVELLDREYQTNARGTFLCCQKAGLMMAEQSEGGSIITIGDWAIVRPYMEHAAYFLAKGSLPTVTRALAVELAELNSNIRVNCVLPGPVMLPDSLSDEERKQAINATLVKKEGSPQNVAHAVRFFVENDFVTGVCLPIDGGRTVYARGE